MRKKDEWKKECMEKIETKKGPGAEEIKEVTERKRLAQRKSENSKYFLRAAKNQLESDTPQAAVVLGYFAVENKVEQALALAGYEVHTHLCTIKGLSRVLERSDLATELDRAYNIRKDINYETRLGEGGKSAERYMEQRIEPLIEKIEDIINNLKE